MENIIEKYAQYLEKPDIMGAKILNYAEHLLKSNSETAFADNLCK